MDPIEQVVIEASRPVQVSRATAATLTKGRLTAGVETRYTVALTVQIAGASSLLRIVQGDTSVGTINVWASKTALAAAYITDDVNKTAQGWTELRVAKPKNSGVAERGDHIVWFGRLYEITSEAPWDADGLIPLANLRNYVATDRGVAP